MNKEELFRMMAEVDPVEFRNELMEVQQNMEAFGGSFEKALAEALVHADMNNAVTIKIAFYDLWKKWLNWKKI